MRFTDQALVGHGQAFIVLEDLSDLLNCGFSVVIHQAAAFKVVLFTHLLNAQRRAVLTRRDRPPEKFRRRSARGLLYSLAANPR